MNPKDDEQVTPPKANEESTPDTSADNKNDALETQAQAEPESVQPVTVQPDAPVKEDASAATSNSAGGIVLQWLTYAFWGWLIAGLIWIMAVILINFILDENVSSVVPYAIAATVVLLPIAFFTDRAYRKREPIKKVGGASVVMIIHAVLFALLGIGTLISAVFILLNMTINDNGNNDTQIVSVLTTSFAALLYAAAFLRTLNPFKLRKPLSAYSIAMAAVSIVLLTLAITGPVVGSIAARSDERLERSLSTIDYAIGDYVREESVLPESLDQLDVYDTTTKELIDNGDITYKKLDTDEIFNSTYRITTEHRYELCATFDKSGDRDTRSNSTQNSFPRSLNAKVHPSGNHCFELSKISYDN